MDAFDSDVLIYAATKGHALGAPVARLLEGAAAGSPAGVGSVLLLTELLPKPLRQGNDGEALVLAGFLRRLDLRPLDRATAELAVALSVAYRLRPLDACHLGTAVAAGADRFITNNRNDFPATIAEIAVIYPDDLPTA